MTTEEKALALVNEALEGLGFDPVDYAYIDRRNAVDEALCRAIEAHEADNARNEQQLADQAKVFSDAVALALTVEDRQNNTRAWRWLSPFILPEPVHPLVQAAADLDLFWNTDMGGRLESALAARGYKIERIEQ